MTESDWEASARDLARDHANRITDSMIQVAEEVGLACPRPTDLRQALVEVDRLMRNAPTPVQRRYKELDEAAIRRNSVRAKANFERASLEWLDLSDFVEAAASQVRALDDYLYDHPDVRVPAINPAQHYLCAETSTHVIPRPLASIPESHRIGTTIYRRRGIIRHRLLPASFDGYEIVPRFHTDLAVTFRNEGSKVSGAIFDEMSLVRHEGFQDFVAKDAPCRDEDGSIATQVENAFAGGVTVACWPELSMPPQRRAKLSAALAARSRIAPLGSGPSIVAAGSWHEIEDDKVYNRLHVLSSMGKHLFSHTKSLPMESRTLGKENLTPTYEIPVLIAKDVLVAFAICRDFCEARSRRSTALWTWT